MSWEKARDLAKFIDIQETKEWVDNEATTPDSVDLIPTKELNEVRKVLEFGARKYEPFGWQKDDPKEQVDNYLSHALHHLSALYRGEWEDKESGLNHAAHLACNALFLIYHINSLSKEK